MAERRLGEAENATISQGAVNSDHAGFTGTGFVNYDNLTGSYVTYAVVGDTRPTDIIGEASYATASSLGINPDPSNGGTDSGVTYLFFKNSKVTPIESHANAVSTGEALARQFVDNH